MSLHGLRGLDNWYYPNYWYFDPYKYYQEKPTMNPLAILKFKIDTKIETKDTICLECKLVFSPTSVIPEGLDPSFIWDLPNTPENRVIVSNLEVGKEYEANIGLPPSPSTVFRVESNSK